MQFYVNTVERGTEGPFETDEVGRRLRAGELPPDALVCLKGSSEWLEPARVPALADMLSPPQEESDGPKRHRTVLEFQPRAAAPGVPPSPAPAGSPHPPPPPKRPGASMQVLSHAPPKPKKLPPPPRVPPKPVTAPDPGIFAALGASDPPDTKPATEESLAASIDSILEEAKRGAPGDAKPAKATARDPAMPVELDTSDLEPLARSGDSGPPPPRAGSTPSWVRWLQGNGRDPRKLVLVIVAGAVVGLAVAVALVALSREDPRDLAASSAPPARSSAVAPPSPEPPPTAAPVTSTPAAASARPLVPATYADQERLRAAASKANFGMTPSTFAALEAVTRLLDRAADLSDTQLAPAHSDCLAPRLRALAAKPDEQQKMLAGAAAAAGDLQAAPVDDAERAARVRALQGSPIYAECALRAGCALIRSRKVERSELVGELEPDAVPVFNGLLCDATFPALLAAELAGARTP